MSTDKGMISLAWEAPKEKLKAPVDGYVIEMITGYSNEFEEFAKVVCDTLTYEATGLKNGQKYNFRIKAENCSGSSSGVQLEKAVVAAPPSVGKGTVNLDNYNPSSLTYQFIKLSPLVLVVQ